ncbi:O-methyltransferase [Virgisporangium ochraceum]|uniref:O-methyltransferase n=1 Tax=Virgisporangium ochraceum TaxID=65505 RepID=A0A8J4A238_9ACTN|nr:O-methyltransferase [Virgisporangium ochraceum]
MHVGAHTICHERSLGSLRDGRRCAITARFEAHVRDFANGYVAEDALLTAAREHAEELGLAPVSPAAGAALRLVAAAGAARAVVEIGTGTGVSGLWLLRGMRADGVLTTIDVEAEHQRVARRVFASAGLAPSRTRIITGRARDVLPRLADGVYDLVFVHHDRLEYAAAVAAAARLLRPGGLLVLGDAWSGGRLTDPTARDPQTVALREVLKALRDEDGWLPAFLPTADGLACAVRR